MTHRNLSFWLLPCLEDSANLQSVIDDFAKRHDAPVFKPHLTLCYGQFSDEESPWGNLPFIEPISLPVLGVDSTSQYTKTLFLRFPRNERLLALKESLLEQCPKPDTHVMDPHLSLLYAELPLSEKQQLAKNLIPPLSNVCFTEIQVIRHPATVTRKEDVEAFRKVTA